MLCYARMQRRIAHANVNQFSSSKVIWAHSQRQPERSGSIKQRCSALTCVQPGALQAALSSLY